MIGVLITFTPDDAKADAVLDQAIREGMSWEDAPDASEFANCKGKQGTAVIKFLNEGDDDAGENLDDPESGEEWKRGGNQS